MRILSKEDAQLLIETFEIDRILGDEEEKELMEANNPELLTAYENLQAVADGSD